MLNGNGSNFSRDKSELDRKSQVSYQPKEMAESYDAYMDVKACADGGFRVSNDAAIKPTCGSSIPLPETRTSTRTSYGRKQSHVRVIELA